VTVTAYKAKDLPPDVTRVEITVYEEAPPAPPPPPAPPAKGAPKKNATPKPAPPRPRVVNILIVPDGARSWLVVSPSLELATAKAKAILPNAPDTGTLAKRGALEPLRDPHASSGGLLSMRGVISPSPFRYLFGETKVPRGGAFGGLGATPSRGGTPIAFFTTGDPKTWTLSAKVPKEAIVDIVKTTMRRF
jgi:hypothetical protein